MSEEAPAKEDLKDSVTDQADTPAVIDGETADTPAVTEPQEVVTIEETPELVESGDLLEEPTTTTSDLAPEVVDEATHTKTNNDKRPLRVLFLSDETGGGHRASAEALGKQFMIQYPGSTVEICNLWTEAGDRVFKSIVKSYKHMSASPWQWKLFYHATNTKVAEAIGKNHSNIFCAEKVKARISEFEPDAVISVHPTMNHLARIQTRLIGKELGKHIPFYTVVTDLGSAHGTWFEPEVNKVYVASSKLQQIAEQRQIPTPKIVKTGLPIRHGFAVQHEALNGDRTCEASKLYIQQIRQQLGLLQQSSEEEEEEMAAEQTTTNEEETEEEQRDSASPSTKPTSNNSTTPIILVMGGGEGVGSLSDIVNQLYATLTLEGQDATLCVVCGRNASLKEELEHRDWFAVVESALQERLRKRKMNRTLKERFTATPPPNFCSPDTILCDGVPKVMARNNSVDGPKSMEQVMAEAALLPSPVTSPRSQSPVTTTQDPSPLMTLITKLPGITEKKAPTLTDAGPVDNSSLSQEQEEEDEDVGLNPTPSLQAPPPIQPGKVNVVGLGFVTNMEEYMVAADILVTKAGPGTIAEAAAVGLPVMLTSFLPGQEAGNVDVVLEAGFGDFCVDPLEISGRVCSWLSDSSLLQEMSKAAHKAGYPLAADDIVADIGSETVIWMKMNERWKGDSIYQPFIEHGHTLVLDSYLHDKIEMENLARTSSETQLANIEGAKRRSFATAAGVGVGAAVGAVVAGPLLPVGLMVGSAVIPALPVGLVVGGGLSGLAANQLNKKDTTLAQGGVGEEADDDEEEDVKEGEEKEERDDEAPKSRFFRWRANPASPTDNDGLVNMEEPTPVDDEKTKSKWFGGWAKKALAETGGDESLVSAPVTTGANATTEASLVVQV